LPYTWNSGRRWTFDSDFLKPEGFSQKLSFDLHSTSGEKTSNPDGYAVAVPNESLPGGKDSYAIGGQASTKLQLGGFLVKPPASLSALEVGINIDCPAQWPLAFLQWGQFRRRKGPGLQKAGGPRDLPCIPPGGHQLRSFAPETTFYQNTPSPRSGDRPTFSRSTFPSDFILNKPG